MLQQFPYNAFMNPISTYILVQIFNIRSYSLASYVFYHSSTEHVVMQYIMDWNEDIILEGQWTQHSISSDPQSFTSHFFLTQRCICFIWYPNSMPFIYSWGHLYHSTTKAIRSRVLIWHFHSAFDEINLIFDHIYLNGDGPTSQESLGVSFICLCIPDIPVFAAFQENFRPVPYKKIENFLFSKRC